ncbi:MAG: NAD(P)H-binding protein [Myxococcota bacterium]|nr:NAD(P)H-binding protein [Myxococcota bacterium]
MTDSKANKARLILVIGGTSGTGKLVAEQLLARGERVRLGARDLEKARARFGDKAELVELDLTRPGEAFDRALEGVTGLVFTAAIPGAAGEALVKSTEYGGVVATVDAAHRAGFSGRLVYMTAIGIHHRTFKMRMLGLLKWNGVHWRQEAERALTESGLDVAIVRAARLTDSPAGQSGLAVVPGDIPSRFGPVVPRADVARVILATLEAPAPLRDLCVYTDEGTAPDDVTLQRLIQSGSPATTR